MRLIEMRRAAGVAALCCLLALGGGLTPTGAAALQPEEQLSDPALEARARALSKGLRCVVCQNQTIDESDAALAGDMRRLVRTRLLAGDTDQQILDRLEAAYGEYVHMRPRFSLENLFLWAAGPLALGLGILLLARRVRRDAPEPAGPQPPSAALSPEEEARLKRLLEE